MAPYMTHCDLCDFKFTTTRALLRHRRSRHQNARPVKHLPFYKQGRIYHIPDSMGLLPNPTLTQEFKVWISGVVESINSTLHPKVSGKWSRVERLDCPDDFLKLLLAKLPSVFVNSAKERPHWKPPIWKPRATVVSWKCYNLEEVKAALDSNSTPLVLSKAFNGDEEVADFSSQVTGIQAITLAKARARGQKDLQHVHPTCRTSLVIGEGEGRATREFEIIWWPDLYTTAPRGKITLRYYVGKVQL